MTISTIFVKRNPLSYITLDFTPFKEHLLHPISSFAQYHPDLVEINTINLYISCGMYV